ncbi:MAG: sugar phosphate isomerase/epimerase [Armatimonadetes bacterium]|nr:sugar phosphate isomerase/epimerase [Armatimonadota bacterium]CUU37279.1 Sugar phosphate isomerase/epimerase [Armatimonadetes bacterium DC]
MKLSVITDEISPDLQEALQVASEFPIEQVELRSLWGANIADADEEVLNRARALLREYGIGVCSIASPVFKADLFGTRERGRMHAATERPVEAHWELLQRCLKVAQFFEAPLVRIFAFWRAGELTPEREAQIVAMLERALPYAERTGVVLGLENEHACQVGTGKELAQILRHFNTPYLKGVWDPGNAFVLGESAQEGFAACHASVCHIHIKDGVREPDGSIRWVIVGEGEIGYAEHFRQIAQSGYRGFLSLETHAQVAGLTQAEVSRRCLQAMARLLRAV